MDAELRPWSVNALARQLERFGHVEYINDVRLVDFKVRIAGGVGAVTRVSG